MYASSQAKYLRSQQNERYHKTFIAFQILQQMEFIKAIAHLKVTDIDIKCISFNTVMNIASKCVP